MKRLALLLSIMMILLPGVLFAADAGPGTYLTLTPDDTADDASEGVLYYDSDNGVLYLHDAGGWFGIGPNHFQFDPVASPTNAAGAAETTEGVLYYDSDTDRLYIRTGAAVWEPLNEQTLDEAYDESATITVDAGAITLNNTEVDAQNTLTIANSGAAGTGQAVSITDTKTGAHAAVLIDLTAGNASSGGVHVRDNASDTTNLSYLFLAESVDGTKSVQDGYKAQATTSGMLVDAFDGSDAEITNALNAGANTITGTETVIDFTWLDLAAEGDLTLTETGGNAADPDLDVAGFCQLGSVSGGILGDDTNYTAWDGDGVLTFAGNARPTYTKWYYVAHIPRVAAAGSGTNPDLNIAATNQVWSTWTYTEATDSTNHIWRVPEDMDVSAALNIFLLWTTEDAGNDTCLWRVRYAKWAGEGGTLDAPDTALDTPIADDTCGQYLSAQTAAGVINGATLAAGNLLALDIYLTDCDDGSEADLIGYGIQYYKTKP